MESRGRVSRAGAGISGRTDPAGAAAEACEAALAPLGADPTGAFLFATADHGPALPELVAAAGDVLGVAPVGASAAGVLVAGEARESGPGVAVLAFTGIEAEPFLLSGLAGAEARAGEVLRHQLEGPVGAGDLVVLLPDPLALSPAALLAALEPALDGAAVVGAGAVDGPAMPPVQWAEGEVGSGAVAGMVIRGAHAPGAPRIGVTQACRPVTPPHQVTRCDGHWVLEIDGRPALDLFREVARGPLAKDLRRAASYVLVALPDPADPETSLREGNYRVRNVAGFSDAAREGSNGRAGFALAEPIRSGDRLAFVLREPHGARDDLKRMLGALPPAGADFGIFLDCCARGAALFDVPGLEAAYLQEALGSLPLVGMLGAYEIGPVRGRTELLTYTGVLALAGGGGAQGQALA